MHAQRMEHMRSYYLASNKGSKERGGASISPHFALQSAFMELSDANVEMEAMRLRTTHIDDILARTQEDALPIPVLRPLRLQRRYRSLDLVKCTITSWPKKGSPNA